MIRKLFGRFVAGLAVAATLAAAPVTARAETIVDLAAAVNQQTGEFSTLLAAAKAAGLVPVLNNKRLPLTVFAPTDAAFAKVGLDAKNVATLPKDILRQVLLYHVTPGKRLSGNVLASKVLPMMNGQFTRVKVNDSGAYINSSRLLASEELIDIEASNGVIHVIDAVLVPPSFK
jgi:uncharacterized surface protein with fasciclin (FAS1) repeats